MKTVFITSSPDGDLGGNNGGSPEGFNNRNNFAHRLREVLPKSVFFTFFAAFPDDPVGNESAAEYFAGVFERTGIHVSGYAVCDSRNPGEAKALLEKSDVIILGGGHVPTQNRFFNEIGLRELLVSFDGTIIGISAGSMNSADIVYAQPEEPGEAVDPDYVRFMPGLNLTKIQIIPHYQLIKDSVLDGMPVFEEITAKDSYGHCFYILRDGSYILIRDGITRLYGEAWTMRDGIFETFSEYGEEKVL